jgi:hypothetical protein
MEPEWTKQIPSKSICDIYYGVFIFIIVIGIITLFGTIFMFFGFKFPKGFESLSYGYGFLGIMTSLLYFITSLFQYLVCSRALLGEQVVTIKKEAPQ